MEDADAEAAAAAATAAAALQAFIELADLILSRVILLTSER